MSSRVVFVSYRAAKPDGDGGNHRTYQIFTDLQTTFGHDRVQLLTIEDWLTRHESDDDRNGVRPARLSTLPERARHRLARMTENPYRLLTREGWSHAASFGTRGVLSREFAERYMRFARPAQGFELCVVDHPMLDQLREVNDRFGIPTVIAPQNMESLDVGRLQVWSRFSVHKASVDFANELHSLSRYRDRFAISRVEASIMMGVGLSCHYYPYVPVGDVRSKLERIATQRAHTVPERNLFLLVGTANHPPTRRSLEWFLRAAREQGLPRNARVALVGSHVHELQPEAAVTPGLEVRGRVSDEELSDLLSQSVAALVPQRMGFGALTRIPELACAGVPVLTFPHASFAMDPPPGVHVLEDDSWSSLVEGMQHLMECPPRVESEAYESWDRRQARPLGRSWQRIATRC